jgi:hypothetical protein
VAAVPYPLLPSRAEIRVQLLKGVAMSVAPAPEPARPGTGTTEPAYR